MKTIFIFIISLMTGINLYAQKDVSVYKMKNGADIAKSIPYHERYQFEEFMDGKVYFRNGRTTKAKLNYSVFHGEIQFINPYKDTLLLLDNNFIHRITIQDNVFYYSEQYGHVQQIRDYPQIKLGKKFIFNIADKEKYTSHEEYSGTSSISSISYFANRNGEYQYLQANERLVLRKRSVYFLIDKNQRIYVANRTNLVKNFPDSKKALNDYVRANNTNFEDEGDLIKILRFCSTL